MDENAVSAVSRLDDEKWLWDFRILKKEDFLSVHSDAGEDEYNATIRELAVKLSEASFSPPEYYVSGMMKTDDMPMYLARFCENIQTAIDYNYDAEWTPEFREKVESVVQLIDAWQLFDYSRIDFQDEVVCEPDLGSAEDPIVRTDYHLYLTDNQYSDLALRSGLIDMIYDGNISALREGIEKGYCTLDAYVDIEAPVYVDKKPSVYLVLQAYGSDFDDTSVDIILTGSDKDIIFERAAWYILERESVSLESAIRELKNESLLMLAQKDVEKNIVTFDSITSKISAYFDEFCPVDAPERFGNDTSRLNDIKAAQGRTEPDLRVLQEQYLSDFLKNTENELVIGGSEQMKQAYLDIKYDIDKFLNGGNIPFRTISEMRVSDEIIEFSCSDIMLTDLFRRLEPALSDICNSYGEYRSLYESCIHLLASHSEGELKNLKLVLDSYELGYSTYNIPLTNEERGSIEQEIGRIEREREVRQWSKVFESMLDYCGITAMYSPELVNLYGRTIENVQSYCEQTLPDTVSGLIKEYPFGIYEVGVKGCHFVHNATELAEVIAPVIQREIIGRLKQDLKNEGFTVPRGKMNYERCLALGESLKQDEPAGRQFVEKHSAQFKIFELLQNHLDKVDLKRVVHQDEIGPRERIRLPETENKRQRKKDDYER